MTLSRLTGVPPAVFRCSEAHLGEFGPSVLNASGLQILGKVGLFCYRSRDLGQQARSMSLEQVRL